ncbi:MAG: acyltransferase [Shimia sp.]
MDQRHHWIDVLRLVAGLSIIGLHATSDANGQAWPAAAEAERIAPMMLRAVLYVARTELFLIVSIFVMLASLDARPRSYGTAIGGLAARIAPPFLFWTVFYALFSLLKADAFGYGAVLRADLARLDTWAEYLLLGGAKYHMHFLPTLFALTLFYPMFRIAQRHPWVAVLGIALLMGKRELDGVLYAEMRGWGGFDYALRALKVTTYVSYGLFAAAMLGLWQRNRAALAPILPLVLLCASLLMAIKFAGAWQVVETGKWAYTYAAGYWADYLMPVLVFAAGMATAHRRWPDGAARAARYTFGSYLCHPAFLDLSEIALRGVDLAPIALIAAKTAMTLVGTGALLLLLSQSRWLGWTVGLGPMPRLAMPRLGVAR